MTRAGLEGRTRLDCIDLMEKIVAVERTTWGRIKTLYGDVIP